MKVGDTVICVNNEGVAKALQLGYEYKIYSVQLGGDTVLLDTDPFKDTAEHGWMPYRFSVVEEIKNQQKFSNYKEVCFDVL